MTEMHFEAEIARDDDAVPEAAIVERSYGAVRVVAEWPERLDKLELCVALTVTGDFEERDAPAYVELFFHDVFLLLNLSSPGSFGGTIAMNGGDLRVRELRFSPRVFRYARGLANLPLDRVTAWYDSLRLGTRQIAMTAESIALFELLRLSRSDEDEEMSVVRLARAADAIVGRPDALAPLFSLRDALANSRTPVFHPMHDDGLDRRVADATSEWIEAADAAATAVIAALQERIAEM